jgi:flavin-dependent dehydrogenase
MELHFGRRTKRATLPEPAYGLSRYAFDDLLLSHACANGARIIETGNPQIVATGRGSRAGRDRLFGFKAHFDGPADDAVELYFFDGSYVGLNCVEGGRTNICGLAPERLLRQKNFDIDEFIQRSEALGARLSPLRRSMKWLRAGPLDFRQNWTREDVYLAGDALSFVDPFTGSGLLSAVISGALAGQHAASRRPVAEHARACRDILAKPFAFSSALRRVASTHWAEWLVGMVSGEMLFRLTRPAVR